MSVKTTVLLGVAVLVVAVGAIVAVVVHPLAGTKAAITYGSMDGYTDCLMIMSKKVMV